MSNDHDHASRNDDRPSASMPDDFDRYLGLLDKAQGVSQTKPTQIRVTPPMGIGGSTSYSVTTFRQEGDFDETKPDKDGRPRRKPAVFVSFLEIAKGERNQRVVIPNEISAVLLRQRDTLTAKAQRRAAKHSAEARKKAGVVPFGRKAR